MDNLLKDLRYGMRALIRKPGFTSVVVITLALGIGANSAIFSIVDKLLLRSLPVKDPQELVLLTAESVNPRFLNTVFSYPDYLDYRDKNDVLSGLVAFSQQDMNLSEGEQIERVRGEMVSANYFDMLGLNAARGRTFLAEEGAASGAHPVAVVSHGLWQRRLGGDPDLIGKTITINDVALTVVGIAPKEFRGTLLERPTDLWIPLVVQNQFQPGDLSLTNRRSAWVRLMGRRLPGVSLEQAQLHIDTLARQIREANTPASNRNMPFYERRMLAESGARGISLLRNRFDKPLTMIAVVVGLILLIACANVANLLLARANSRRKEMAIRLALGASRARIISQLLAESSLLAAAGGAAGLLLAPWLSDVMLAFQLNSVNPAETPLGHTVDARVLGFTLLVSVAAAVFFGLVPAFASSRSDLIPALKDESARQGHRDRLVGTRNLLVIAQVALSLVVLVGAGLFIKSIRNLFAIDPGFKPEGVLVVSLDLPSKKYNEASGGEFYRGLTERLKAMPGVEAVSSATVVPLGGGRYTRSVAVEGYQPAPGENIGLDTNDVGPGYHELMGIQIVEGRGFTERDRTGAPAVAIVNEAFAAAYFPGQSAAGRRMSLGPGNPWIEIVGVTRNVKHHDLTAAPIPHFDLPALQRAGGLYSNIQIRTSGNPSSLIPAVRRAVKEMDPAVTELQARTLGEQVSNSISAARMAAAVTSLFGVCALALAAVGIYGVIAYSVSRRTREIGIRLALGAQHKDVLRQVLVEGMTTVGIGVTIGLAGAYASSRLVEGLLYGVSATDPLAFAAVALVLAAVALLACYIPARRAARVDPMVALRYE
jgi:putative ABC transport system permease protein